MGRDEERKRFANEMSSIIIKNIFLSSPTHPNVGIPVIRGKIMRMISISKFLVYNILNIKIHLLMK